MRKRRSQVGVGQLVLQMELPTEALSDGTRESEGNRNAASSAAPSDSKDSQRRRKHYSLYDKVCTRLNLWKAWKRVAANKGSRTPGCDGVTAKHFAEDAPEQLKALRQQLREKTYRPRPVQQKLIPKAGGGTRKLGIPCLRDRIVQQAIKQILEPLFEPEFSKHSHGFRPGRGCATALKTVDWAVFRGKLHWVVDIDLKDFFDTVDHELLLTAVNEQVADGSVLRLIRRFLESGILTGDLTVEPTEEGTPQGSPLSPLLANIYLHAFDKAMLDKQHHPVRYADDIVLFASSQQAAERALTDARQVLEGELKLTLHPVKTQLVPIEQGFAFLGFRYFRDSQGRLQKVPRRKSEQSFRDAVRKRTRRHSGQRRPKLKHLKLSKLKKNQSLREMIHAVNAYLRGWHWYFKTVRTTWREPFRNQDAFVRRRLRSRISGRYGNGWWRQRIPNRWLTELGLLSLADLQRHYQTNRLSAPHTS